MKSSTHTYDRLAAKISAFRRKRFLVKIGEIFFLFINLSLPAVFLLLAAEALFRLSTLGRIVLLAVFGVLGVIFVVFALYSIWKLVGPLSEPSYETALTIGRHLQGVNDRLANALQLFENRERDKKRYSKELIEASLQKSAQQVKDADFNRFIDFSSLRNQLIRSVIMLMLLLTGSITFHSSLSAAAYRFCHPSEDFGQNVIFFVRPGDISVLKGTNLKIAAALSDSTVSAVMLSLNAENNTQSIPLVRAQDDSFRHTIENVRHDFSYSLSAGKSASRSYTVRVIERPLLRSFQLSVEPPSYSKLKPFDLDANVGDLSVLKGSNVRVQGVANKPIKEAMIRFSQSGRVPLQVNGRRISGRFRVMNDDDYSYSLLDDDENENASPIEYSVKIVEDNEPLVEILSPGKDIDLDDSMQIPLLIECIDDFGISRLDLRYYVLSGGTGELDTTAFATSAIKGIESGSEKLRVALNWDLSKSEMYPTDVLFYFVEAYDNDAISGPKMARSSMYSARFPSLYEMYEEAASEQDESTDQLEEALERSRELEQKLQKMTMEMKRASEMDWQKKKEIEDALAKQDEIQEQVEKALTNLEEMAQNIEKHHLFSQETMKKLDEIQNLFKEIMTPELQDILQDMAEAMQNLDEKMLQRAMENLQLNVEEYSKTLDRTISLLKKLKAQQQLEQALKMAQDLENRQKQLGEQAKNPDANSQKLANEQERIAKDAENLSDVLDKLQQELKQIPASPEQEVQQAKNLMDQESLQQNLSELQQNMASNQMTTVPQQSKDVEQTFQKVAQNLDMAQQMMSGEMQRQAMQAMKKSGRELLQLSQQQEELMQQLQSTPTNSPQFLEWAEKQQQTASSLQRVINSLAEAMRENFGLDPQIARAMGKAFMQMENATNAITARNSQKATKSQGEAMAQLNAAVRALQQSMQNAMQQGGAGGMTYQQFLQQMQQMADQQGQINQQTQAMGNPGQLSLGQQAAMARLAAEQQQLRKSMEQLAKEAAGMSEILGSLEEIAGDMKKVGQDFANKQITRETIRRQNRILSRMLDAQKSVNKREFSRERQAETGKHYTTTSPGALPNDLGNRNNQLQQELLRAKKEGYTLDYLQVIEKYFKALTEHELDQ